MMEPASTLILDGYRLLSRLSPLSSAGCGWEASCFSEKKKGRKPSRFRHLPFVNDWRVLPFPSLYSAITIVSIAAAIFVMSSPLNTPVPQSRSTLSEVLDL